MHEVWFLMCGVILQKYYAKQKEKKKKILDVIFFYVPVM